MHSLQLSSSCLKFCSVSNEKFYEKLFYKFKIIDHKGQDGKTMIQRVKSSERRYDISGIETLEKGKTLPIDYGIGGTYKFSGYATGFGADTRENTLTCAVTELETIQLEVHKTNFRTGEYKTNHRHDLTSVYFSVPQKFFDNYGSLQKIKAEWYEYKTSPIVVTSNSTVYNGLVNQIGVNTNGNTQRISLYSGYQELVGASGHYNKYNFGYNVVGEVNDRLDTLNYVFSTNGSDISKYVLTSSRLQSYIESYTKTYANGKIEIPGKTLSADLFESGLDSNRRNVAFVEDDIHHKLVNIDADDTFNMLNHSDSNSGAVRFFSWLFGLGPTEVDSSYTNVKPIHIVSEEERNDSNISKTLLIDGSDNALKQFKDFYDREKEKGNKTVLFRFAETDYETIPVIAYDEYSGKNLSKDYGKDTFVVRESVFLNFDIIELTFSRNGTYTVIPVVSNPIDIYNDITIPEVVDKYAWLKKLIVIILLILLLIVLLSTGILPLVIKGVIYVIILPFKAVGWCLKTIIEAFKKEKLL